VGSKSSPSPTNLNSTYTGWYCSAVFLELGLPKNSEIFLEGRYTSGTHAGKISAQNSKYFDSGKMMKLPVFWVLGNFYRGQMISKNYQNLQ